MNDVLPDSDSYRDARPGAEARRDALLRRNRDSLAELPLELRRVYVRRVARACAGLAVVAGSFAAALAAASAPTRALLEGLIPGQMPAVASDLILMTPIAGLMVYFIARALAEERFTRAMIAAVRPGRDVFTDVDRLVVTPLELARRLAERSRARSFAAVVAAAAIAAPLAAVVLAAFVELDAWERLSAIEFLSWRAGAPLMQVAIASLVLGAAWLAISRDNGAASLLSRARRSAGVLVASALLMLLLGALSSGEPRIFTWTWGAWGMGAAAGLLWASGRAAREDACAPTVA
jgi:hypothetical protein